MSRKIGVASLIWGVSILLSRVVGIVRESVIGRTMGGGADADVYWSAFVLPDFLNYLLAGGALSLVFIPIFSGYLGRDDEAGGWNAFSVISTFLIAAMSLLIVGLWFAAPQLATVVAPGFSPEQHEDLVRLTRIILPAQLFHFQGGLLSATLQARDKHLLPALAPLLYTASIVIFGVALFGSLGVDSFAWGVLVGSVLGPFGLPLIGNIRAGMRWRLNLDLRHPDFRSYLLLSLPVMLGFSVVVVDDWMFKRFGSATEGLVSQLQYAKTLMKVPMGVFGLATGVAAFPTLSRLLAAGEREKAWATLVRAARLMLVMAFTAQAAVTAAGEEIATVIWGTARFGESELQAIGLYTGLLCLGLGAWSAQSLIARGFYAMQNTWAPTVVGSIAMLLAYPVYSWAGANHGGVGLALTSSATITIYVIALSTMLRRRLGGAGPRISPVVLRMAPAALIGWAAGEGVSMVVELPHGVLGALVEGSLAGGVALCATLLAGWALRVEEIGEVVSMVRRRVAR